MKRFLLISSLTALLLTSGFAQKKVVYDPKNIEHPEKVLEELLSKDPKQGKQIDEINITKQRVSISSTKSTFEPATGYKKTVIQSVLLKEITKLQIIHQNETLYILEVYDSRQSKKQFIIFSNTLEDIQKCTDALYTLQQRAISPQE
jgi:hypothetical protein